MSDSGLAAVHLAATVAPSTPTLPAVPPAAAAAAPAPAPAPAQRAPASAAELASAYPEAVAAIRTEAATAERARLLGIDRISAGADPALIAQCRNDPAVTPEAAALRILEAGQQRLGAQLASIQNVETVTGRVEPAAAAVPGAAPVKLSAQQLADKTREYQAEQAKIGNRITLAQALVAVEQQLGL